MAEAMGFELMDLLQSTVFKTVSFCLIAACREGQHSTRCSPSRQAAIGQNRMLTAKLSRGLAGAKPRQDRRLECLVGPPGSHPSCLPERATG
jgi:hypothetical protein